MTEIQLDIGDWANRLDIVSKELSRLDTVTTADEVTVRTRRDSTTVTLVYEHEDIDPIQPIGETND